jgi:MFS family permease
MIIAMGVLAYGYDSAFIGTTITQKSFLRDFGISKMTKAEQNNVSSNLTSIYSAGGFFGALFMVFSLELLGRRATVIISDAIFIVGAILCTGPKHLGTMYAGRLLTGLGVGGIAAVSPIYTSEMAPPAIRGRLTGFFESFYQVGAVIGFWINYGIVHNIDTTKSIAWRIPMAVQFIPAVLLALGIPFLRESPVWLLKKGRTEQAIKVYSYIRDLPADHQYITEDVAFVKGQIEYERAVTTGGSARFGDFLKAASKEAFMKGMRNRFALVFIMFMWQAWSGAAAINYCKHLPPFHSLYTPPHAQNRLSNNLHIHRPDRLHPLDWYLRSHQSCRQRYFLHLVYRQVRAQVAVDYILAMLCGMPVLSRRVYCYCTPVDIEEAP